MSSKSFTAEEARRIGEQFGIDWSVAPFDLDEFRAGMDVELEHGMHDERLRVKRIAARLTDAELGPEDR